MMNEKECPKCGISLEVLLFMGVEPEEFVCPKCNVMYSFDDLKPIVLVIGG
jgi:uncharacterized protein YbaR (Trm112 family)